MLSLERTMSLGIESQFSLEAEAKHLPHSERLVMDDILHLIAEFACHTPLVSYHYLQTKDNSLVIPGLEHEGDVLNVYSRGVRENSRRSWLEYEGFYKLRKMIIETQDPSFAVWISPPGPKEEGYGDYGFFYIALIPQNNYNQERRISSLALRINNFDAEMISKSKNLLQVLAPQNTLPQNATTNDLLLHPVIFPVGEGHQIKTIQDLFSQISSFLGIKLEKDEIESGLSGKVLAKIKEKFRAEIYEIFTILWSIAQGIPTTINEKKLFASLPIDHFSGGSCPSKSETEIPSSKSTKKENNETHWCPQCGQFFQGNQCGCGYRFG